ncbi:1-phosphofructokinase [Clostridium sp. CAG:167]|nr:1-phosphofructokinase [Clostridium sp. CAG:167]
MIYTVTLNPSLDYVVDVDDFELGRTNRAVSERLYAGGKGINVSFVLKNLGFESTALGFSAGFTGEEIKKQIQERGITENLITVLNGQSRINIKLRGQQETEINGMGPDIEKEHIQQLLKKLSVLSPGDYLILAGSVPMKINDTIYYDILKTLDKKGIKAVVDTTGDLLLNVLKYHPFLIKPNIHELSELFSTEIKTKEEVVQYGLKLQDMGAQNVIVSMAGDGAVFICENGEIYKSEAPKGVVKNSVGAGDSMVAGFLAGFCETKDFAKAFKMGICTGSASAFSEDLATKEQVRQVMDAHSFDF